MKSLFFQFISPFQNDTYLSFNDMKRLFASAARRVGSRAAASSDGFAVGGKGRRGGEDAKEAFLLSSRHTMMMMMTKKKMEGRAERRHKTSSTTTRGDENETTKNETKKELYAVFTCGKCGVRSSKGFSKRAYNFGVVIVTCPGCQSKHVLADRLGWFGEKGDVEDFLRERKREQGDEDVRDETKMIMRAKVEEDGTLEFDADELEAWRERLTPQEKK